MEPAVCPPCGLSTAEGAGTVLVTSAARVSLDRLMNWVMGALLVAATSALVVVQAHPPH
ncbi:MAG TPA: hypothetical protein VG013_32875 [Gemmataceae bacterium]|jgi:hypothetical protein|nr:hypothetical protein [Gemmataceae bacterium]